MTPTPSTAVTVPSVLIPAALDRPGDDPIFALHAEAQRRQKAGEDVVNATIGALMEDAGPLAILPVVRDTLAAVDPVRAAAYAPIAGEPAFLQAVIDDAFGSHALRERAVAVATPGGTGAIHHAIANFLEPGQALLTSSYYWGPYETLATQGRRAVETFEMFDAQGGFNVPAFERALGSQMARQGRALVLLNTPCHNPTGFSMHAPERKAVAALVRQQARRGPVALLIDNAYAHFGGSQSGDWVGDFAGIGDEAALLVAWTVSKSFAQYGARVGALVAAHADPAERSRIFNALSFSCRGTWSNCNHQGMLAITELLTDPAKRARVERERARLIALLDERVRAFNQLAPRAGLSYPRYEGGFFVTVFTPDPRATAARMRELGVYVVPVHRAVRVALCATAASAVPRVVEALRAGVAVARP
jgi:aromatic-amino-acid transaminase